MERYIPCTRYQKDYIRSRMFIIIIIIIIIIIMSREEQGQVLKYLTLLSCGE
jgi:hypothetical protein